MPDIENVIPLTEIPKQDNPVAIDWVLGTHNNNTVANRFQISALKSIISPIDSVDTDNLTISNRQLTIASDAGTKTKMIALDTVNSNIITSAFGDTSSIYKTLDGIAKKVGYDVSRSPSTFDNSTYVYTLSITRNNDKTDPADISAWAQSLITDFYGSAGTPTKDSSGHWNWTPNAAFALNVSASNQPNYIKAFKSNIFDNAWLSGKSYAVGAVVVYDNKLYKCNYANSDATFNTSHWDLLSGGGGGGGLPADGWEQWKDLFDGVVNGLTRALDVNEGWQGSGSSQEETGEWSSTLKSNYGYEHKDPTSGTPIPNWGEYSNIILTDESLLSNSNLKFRGKILETLNGMAKGYQNLTSCLEANSGGSYTNSTYQSYVFNDVDNGTYKYNNKTDLMTTLLKLTQPKVVTGVFKVTDWQPVTLSSVDVENYLYGVDCAEDLSLTYGYFYCPLTQINNPDNVPPIYRGYQNTQAQLGYDNPNGAILPMKIVTNLNEDMTEDDICDGITGIVDSEPVYAKVFDIERYLVRISRMHEEYQKILAYNLIKNLVTVNGVITPILNQYSGQSTYNSNSRDASHDQLYYKCFEYATPTEWSAVKAFTSINGDPPEVDIPVKFLVFPPIYDLNNIIV